MVASVIFWCKHHDAPQIFERIFFFHTHLLKTKLKLAMQHAKDRLSKIQNKKQKNSFTLVTKKKTPIIALMSAVQIL